jgi:two-component system sensor histidine kinase and response regulator WspE
MRPFSEAASGLPRMVRDVARGLGKDVKLEIEGGATEVDRDILEQLKAPLMHLLRNAIDHGIEGRELRQTRGKTETGAIRVHARHGGGMLLVSVADDGNGIDQSALRKTIAAKHLASSESAGKMSDDEVFQFLFLPGFTMKDAVTDISGRGVGLDVVQTAMQHVGGTARVFSEHGKGTRFDLELPLTLALVRALLVEISGEAYALPLARVTGVAKLQKGDIESTEGRQHFKFRNASVGLVSAHQLLALDSSEKAGNDVCVVVISNGQDGLYGIAVDRFLGERELVVLALDAAIGKVRNISAAALLPDESPVLIVDIDDLLRSVENVIAGARIERVVTESRTKDQKRKKRILAVDDSLTVRELERKLLQSRGYVVETAVDGMDAWNAARHGDYDLIVTDVDMPRMDGIELLTLIKNDPKLRALPVMIVSYKDRDIDRRRGLDAGADYYLTKGSFQDEALLQAVTDLIGDPES